MSEVVEQSAAGGWGPKGQPRNWIVVVLLSIITCGIYGLWWQYRMFEDNKQFSGEGVGGAVGLILAIFVGIVNIFLLPAEIGNIYERLGREKRVKGTTGFWVLLPIIGAFIWYAKVQNAENGLWES